MIVKKKFEFYATPTISICIESDRYENAKGIFNAITADSDILKKINVESKITIDSPDDIPKINHLIDTWKSVRRIGYDKNDKLVVEFFTSFRKCTCPIREKRKMFYKENWCEKCMSTIRPDY